MAGIVSDMALFSREFIAVPDDRKGQIVFKWPDVTIRRFTHAIVNADEVALFVNTGQIAATMGPGRHSVDADEIPGLGAIIDFATGGNAYRAELYFVGTREYTGFKFGGRVDDVQDPRTGLVVTLRVFGDYALRVIDPARLITNLTATVDVTDNERIAGWVSDQVLKVLRTNVTTQVVANGWPILGLSVHSPEIEQAAITAGNGQLEAYGIAVTRMGNFDINLSPEDAAQLKQLAKDTSYSQLAGGFGQYAAGEMALGAGQGMAKGGGSTEGAFLATGLGLGGALGGAFGGAQQQQQPAQQAPAPAPAPAPQAPAPAGVVCAACSHVEPGRRQVLHGLRPGDGAGRQALHRVRDRAARRGEVLRQLRHPDRLIAACVRVFIPATPGRRYLLGVAGITMYDTILNDQFPPGAAAYAAYVDGSIGNQPNYAYIVAAFPKAQHLSVALFPTDNADALDVEPGASSPSDVPAWYAAQRKRGIQRPCVYASASTMNSRDPAGAERRGHRQERGPAVDRALPSRRAHLRPRHLRRAQHQRRRHAVDAERDRQRSGARPGPVAAARELLHHGSDRHHGGGIAVRTAEPREERAHRDRRATGNGAAHRVRRRQRRPGPAAGQAAGGDLRHRSGT